MKNYIVSKNIIHSTTNLGQVKIIFLNDNDDRVFDFTGPLTNAFIDISNGLSTDQIISNLMQTTKSDKEKVKKFLDTFIKDLIELKILEVK